MTYIDNLISSSRVVFDGQSMNVYPGFPNNFPTQAMVNILNRPCPYAIPAVPGISWTGLSYSAPERTFKWGPLAGNGIFVMTGGHSDIGDELDSAATVYAQMGAYGNAARAVGFDKVIALTITPSRAFFTDTGTEPVRLAFNSLLLADASDYFDAIVDDASIPELMDYTNATYYEQVAQTHWQPPGATLVAQLVAPVIASMLV